MKDYVDIVYNDSNRPLSSYPDKLAFHLFKKFDFKKDQTILEAGCGRGEFLLGFKKIGMKTIGIDLSKNGCSISNELEFVGGIDLENNKWPFEDNSIDIIYSKSLLEHFHNPLNYLSECKRVLKKGGKLLTLTPDWETCYKKFYDDYTHRSPFTNLGLIQILNIAGFEDVEVVKFRQLPILWKYPKLEIISRIIAPFVPVRSKNKFLRWSRELMLIGYSIK
jgi:ubiquinone/menaquinone biosynthesis C-methylase UbiE